MRDAIQLGHPIPVTPQQALDVMRLIELGMRSSEARREIPLE